MISAAQFHALKIAAALLILTGVSTRVAMKFTLDTTLPPEKQPSWRDRNPSLVDVYEDLFPSSFLPLICRACFWLLMAGLAILFLAELRHFSSNNSQLH